MAATGQQQDLLVTDNSNVTAWEVSVKYLGPVTAVLDWSFDRMRRLAHCLQQ